MNYCSVEPPLSWNEKIKRRLFRFVPCDTPLDHRAKDFIRSVIRSELSFLDRLRVLVTGKVEVEICVASSTVCDVVETNAVIRCGRFSNVKYVKMNY